METTTKYKISCSYRAMKKQQNNTKYGCSYRAMQKQQTKIWLLLQEPCKNNNLYIVAAPSEPHIWWNSVKQQMQQCSYQSLQLRQLGSQHLTHSGLIKFFTALTDLFLNPLASPIKAGKGNPPILWLGLANTGATVLQLLADLIQPS